MYLIVFFFLRNLDILRVYNVLIFPFSCISLKLCSLQVYVLQVHVFHNSVCFFTSFDGLLILYVALYVVDIVHLCDITATVLLILFF